MDLAVFQQAAALPYPWIEHGKLATARTVKVEVEGDLGGVVGQVPAGQGLVRQRAFQFAAAQLCDRFVLQVFSHSIYLSLPQSAPARRRCPDLPGSKAASPYHSVNQRSSCVSGIGKFVVWATAAAWHQGGVLKKT